MDPAELKYDDKGLIPAVIQQQDTGEVLMVAYMNEESVRKTLETGLTWFWSRSRQKYWQKGETSGHVQHVKKVLYDCDADTLLVKVDQEGVACHTGERSCFYRDLGGPSAESSGPGEPTAECDAIQADVGVVHGDVGAVRAEADAPAAAPPVGAITAELYATILERKATMPEDSYTAELLRDGLNRVLGKVAEESSELVRAALSEGDQRVVEETADLLYHVLVLLASKDIKLEEVEAELAKRRK